MKYLAPAAFSVALLTSSVAMAQTSTTAAPTSEMQLSQSECTNLWQQANVDKAEGLTEAQSRSYVTDFKAANPDGDTTIDQAEWMTACSKGLVKSSSSTGTSAGEAGKTSDRTPGNPSPDRTPDATGAGAAGVEGGKTPEGTSDRTPSK